MVYIRMATVDREFSDELLGFSFEVDSIEDRNGDMRYVFVET